MTELKIPRKDFLNDGLVVTSKKPKVRAFKFENNQLDFPHNDSDEQPDGFIIPPSKTRFKRGAGKQLPLGDLDKGGPSCFLNESLLN